MRYRIPDHSGHETIEFDKANKADMERAEAKFKELTGLGFREAKNLGGGKQKMPTPGDQKFDPNAEDVTFLRPIQGG